MGKLAEAIEAIQKAENNEPQGTEYQRFFMEPPTVDARYYSNAPGSSKHQCTRKPKPKQRGVKHGNRKKKKVTLLK